MRLDFFLLADSVEREAEKITVLGAIITNVQVDRVPTRVSLGSLARMLVDEWDLNAQRPFEFFVRIAPPEGEPLQTTALAVQPADLPTVADDPEEERSVIVVAALENLPITHLGLYRLELVLNGEVIGRRAVTVSLRQGEESSVGEADGTP